MSKSSTFTMCKNVNHLRYKNDLSMDDIMELSKYKLKNTLLESKKEIDSHIEKVSKLSCTVRLYTFYYNIIYNKITSAFGHQDHLLNDTSIHRKASTSENYFE